MKQKFVSATHHRCCR